jgi:hypothetical protein
MCLPAGTVIHTRHGSVAVEKIRVGDEVLSRNQESGALEYKKVRKLAAPHLDKLLQLRITGETRGVMATPDHPFFVQRTGRSKGDWLAMSQLKIGDAILTRRGTWSKITFIATVPKRQIVYNFEVEDNHNYFIGATGLLAHNSICLFHGTDVASAKDIVEKGLDIARATELGGGDVFWATADRSVAEVFAGANPVGGAPAVVSVTLPESTVTALQSAGTLTIEGNVYQFLPKAWSVLSKLGFSLVR